MTTYQVRNGEAFARALLDARPGDEIVIQPHELSTSPANPRSYVGEFEVSASGTAQNPIHIRALEGALFSGKWTFKSSHVAFEGLRWENFGAGPHIGEENSPSNPIRGLSFRRCAWVHGSSAMRLWYGEDVLYEDCEWGDVRSRVAGLDACAWVLKRYGKRITFRNCQAYDCGSDWLQIMPNSPVCGPAEEILIENCRSWITRPYGSVPWQDFSSNCGENCIDIKGHRTRGVIVRGGEYGGIQPTVPGQDCSGETGCIMRVHYGARDVRFEQVRLYDAPVGIAVSPGSDTGGTEPTGNIEIMGCKFERIERWITNHANLDVTVDHNWPPTVTNPPPPSPDPAALVQQLTALRDQAAGIVSELDGLIGELGRM